ncbi:hypothetical protein IG631_18458 [Alternaria alternata]|nr:hypothetical protein IG631_18458 [Alternaria alternata]
MKFTPPSNRLCLETRSASQFLIFSAVSGVALSCDGGTMYARGSSSPLLTMISGREIERIA